MLKLTVYPTSLNKVWTGYQCELNFNKKKL